MRNIKIMSAILLIAVFVLESAVAQTNAENTAPDTVAVSTKEKALFAYINSPSRSGILELLAQIEDGSISLDADTVKALSRLAGDGTLFVMATQRIGSYNSDIRTRAIILLGKEGSEVARQAIVNALEVEIDTGAKCAAFIALGNMELDNNNASIRVINAALRHDIATVHDYSVAKCYIETIPKLLGDSKPDVETLENILYLADEHGYSQQIRRLAYNYLRTLWR